MCLPMREIIVDQATRAYRTPKCGWNGLVRRVIQFGYMQMGLVPEYDDYGNNLWRGPNGVVQQLQNYAGTSGTRNKKVVREIMEKCLTLGDSYDAGERSKMKRPRKRKLTQEEADLGGRVLRSGLGSKWAATYINRERIDRLGDDKAGVDTRTLERTLHGKYNAKLHHRQKRATGLRDKNSIWAGARLSFCKQMLSQLGKLLVCCCQPISHFISP